MNNYFKNYLLVFFSFFVMPAFAMETKYNSGKEIAAELIALTNLPQEKKSIHETNFLLEQDRRDAENWFNKRAESIQKPKDSEEALLNHLMKYGPYTTNFYKLNSDLISNKENLPFNFNKPDTTVNSKRYSPENVRPYLKESNRSRRAPTPQSASKEFGMDKTEKLLHEKQNCLLM